MATKKPKKSTATKEWIDFPPDIYQEEAARLVHFSGKTVNSNAPACGIRVGRDSGLDLPLVGVRTLLVDGVAVPLDYTRNAGKTATVVKQMRLAESADPPEVVPVEQLRTIQRIGAEAAITAYEEGTDNVSPRLRQILLPKSDGQYLAITPLGSSGLSAVLNQKLAALPEQKKAPFSRALLGMGGSNPQNVGALVREMRNPLLFRSPDEKPLLRRALSIHHKGISLEPPPRLLKDYCAWVNSQLQAHDDEMPSTMKIRQDQADRIGAIAKVVIQRGRRARELLETHRHALPLPPEATSLLSRELKDDLLRGLIESKERDAGWNYRFGMQLAREIEGELRTRWQRPQADSAIAQMARWIEDAIR